MRAGILLTFFYLFGNYDTPQATKNYTQSLYYLKSMVELDSISEDNSLARGSSHKSLLFFLLVQNELIENFEYFDSDPQFYETISSLDYVRKLIAEIVTDFTS